MTLPLQEPNDPRLLRAWVQEHLVLIQGKTVYVAAASLGKPFADIVRAGCQLTAMRGTNLLYIPIGDAIRLLEASIAADQKLLRSCQRFSPPPAATPEH